MNKFDVKAHRKQYENKKLPFTDYIKTFTKCKLCRELVKIDQAWVEASEDRLFSAFTFCDDYFQIFDRYGVLCRRCFQNFEKDSEFTPTKDLGPLYDSYILNLILKDKNDARTIDNK